jgi:hypothetical protein
MGSKSSSSSSKEGKPLNPQEAMVELQEVQHSAAKLEKLVTGHLETLAAAVSNPLVGDGLDDERAYFQVRCKIILVCLWMCSMGWYSYMNEKIS